MNKTSGNYNIKIKNGKNCLNFKINHLKYTQENWRRIK